MLLLCQGLKLLQKTKKAKTQVVARRPGRQDVSIKKVFKRMSDDEELEEEEDQDEIADLEMKIK